MTIKKRGLDRSIEIGGTKPSALRRPVNFPITLAPMVGLSHTSFRRLLMDYTPAGALVFAPTEMLNSRRLPAEELGATPETYRRPDEQGPLIPQILGNEEEPIRRSVEKLQKWGIQGIDINMGCPVAKALRHNYGVSLMGDPHYAAEVVRMTVRWAEVPVSVKLRAVESGQREELLSFVQGLVEAGASWLTLHPRRGSQKRRGFADWDQIGWLRSQISCPLIGNGDVQTAEDVDHLLDESGCDMVMVGRALTARPWLLWQWGERWGWPPPPDSSGLLAQEAPSEKKRGDEGSIGAEEGVPPDRSFLRPALFRAPQTPQEEAQEYGRALRRILMYMAEDFRNESLVLRKFRFFVRMGSPWLDFGQRLGGVIHRAQTVRDVDEQLGSFFQQDLAMSARTDLRT